MGAITKPNVVQPKKSGWNRPFFQSLYKRDTVRANYSNLGVRRTLRANGLEPSSSVLTVHRIMGLKPETFVHILQLRHKLEDMYIEKQKSASGEGVAAVTLEGTLIPLKMPLAETLNFINIEILLKSEKAMEIVYNYCFRYHEGRRIMDLRSLPNAFDEFTSLPE